MGDMTGPKAGAPVKDGDPGVIEPINAGMPSGDSPGEGVLAPGPNAGGGTYGPSSGGFVGK